MTVLRFQCCIQLYLKKYLMNKLIKTQQQVMTSSDQGKYGKYLYPVDKRQKTAENKQHVSTPENNVFKQPELPQSRKILTTANKRDVSAPGNTVLKQPELLQPCKIIKFKETMRKPNLKRKFDDISN